MSLEHLAQTPPWEWPEDAADHLLRALRSEGAPLENRLLAAELAGDIAVASDRIADALLAILNGPQEPAELRSTAAIALGPSLEYADSMGFDEEEDVLISAAAFQRIQEALHRVHGDPRLPRDVRRAALEASVRAPQDWHAQAIQKALADGDEPWKLTAVFCMRYVEGFDGQIIEALASPNAEIRYEAVAAAGNWGLDDAWPVVEALLQGRGDDKDLLLAAIGAAVGIRPQEAVDHLVRLSDAPDADVAEAAQDALAMAEMPEDFEEEDEEP